MFANYFYDLGLTITVDAILKVLLTLFLISFVFLSMGLVLASYVPSSNIAGLCANMIHFAMTAVGGVFYALDNFPSWLANAAYYMPLHQAVTQLSAAIGVSLGTGGLWIGVATLMGWIVIFGGLFLVAPARIRH
jgi:ABC-type multidrug transport system permease subunit